MAILVNTVREKITSTPLSTAQETLAGEQSKSSFEEPVSVRIITLCSIMKHIKDQLKQSTCDNIATLRAHLQKAEAEFAILCGISNLPNVYVLHPRTHKMWKTCVRVRCGA